MGRQDCQIHALEEADGAFGAIAGAEFSGAAGAIADMEILEFDREPHLQDFRIGEPRIGHVHMHTGGSGKAATGVLVAGRRA